MDTKDTKSEGEDAGEAWLPATPEPLTTADLHYLSLVCTCNFTDTTKSLCDDTCDGAPCGCQKCQADFADIPNYRRPPRIPYCPHCGRAFRHKPECIKAGGKLDYVARYRK